MHRGDAEIAEVRLMDDRDAGVINAIAHGIDTRT